MKITVRIAGKLDVSHARVLATLLLPCCRFFIGYRVVFGANGMKVWESKRAEVERLENTSTARNSSTSNCSVMWTGCSKAFPALSRRKRREQLGYVKARRGGPVRAKSQVRSQPAPAAIAENTEQKHLAFSRCDPLFSVTGCIRVTT